MNRLARKRKGTADAAPWFTGDAGAYWLANAQGFRVDAPTRTLGVVEEVRVDEDGRLQSLVVVGGVLGSRSIIVEARHVESVSPRLLRVRVDQSARQQRAQARTCTEVR